MTKVIKKGKYVKKPLQITCKCCGCFYETDDYDMNKLDAMPLFNIESVCPECEYVNSLVVTEELFLR